MNTDNFHRQQTILFTHAIRTLIQIEIRGQHTFGSGLYLNCNLDQDVYSLIQIGSRLRPGVNRAYAMYWQPLQLCEEQAEQGLSTHDIIINIRNILIPQDLLQAYNAGHSVQNRQCKMLTVIAYIQKWQTRVKCLWCMPCQQHAMTVYPLMELEVQKFKPLIFILHSIRGGGSITSIDE